MFSPQGAYPALCLCPTPRTSATSSVAVHLAVLLQHCLQHLGGEGCWRLEGVSRTTKGETTTRGKGELQHGFLKGLTAGLHKGWMRGRRTEIRPQRGGKNTTSHPFFLHQGAHLHFRVNPVQMRVAGSVPLLRRLMKNPPHAFDTGAHLRAFQMCICGEFCRGTPAEQQRSLGEKENLA